MAIRHIPVSVAALLLVDSAAIAATCQIQNAGPPNQWRFVHVYDVDRGKIVLQQAIKSGDSKEVAVSGDQVRVDHKLAGSTQYTTGAVATCKDGATIKF